MIKVSWQDHFKSSLEGAEEAFQTARAATASLQYPTEPAFLTYCLQNSLIDSHDYLAWAKEAHQLPVLRNEFFLDHATSLQLYQSYQDVYAWNPVCMPIAEWDGVLIVACLEIPNDFPTDRPVAFLLAAPEMMKHTWITYSIPVETVMDVQASSLEEPFAELQSEASSKDLFGDGGELILKDDENPEHEGSNPEIIEDSGEHVEEASGMPEGFFAETVVDGKAPSLLLSPLTAPSAASTSPILTKGPRTVEPLASIKAEPLASMSPAPSESEVSENTSASSTSIPSVATAPMPQAPVKTTTQLGATAAYLLEKYRKQNPESFEKEVQESFTKLKPYFKKAMLLAVGDKDRVIKPLLWDANFLTVETTKYEFDLKTPSFFRIVSTTQKPYHGYVVTNDFNDSFFEFWNQGQIPDHITMVPYMDGDQVIGMLLGIGEKSCYNRNVLQFTETVMKDLVANIAKLGAARTAKVA